LVYAAVCVGWTNACMQDIITHNIQLIIFAKCEHYEAKNGIFLSFVHSLICTFVLNVSELAIKLAQTHTRTQIIIIKADGKNDFWND
jgi:hypothetical protein